MMKKSFVCKVSDILRKKNPRMSAKTESFSAVTKIYQIFNM